MYVLMEEGWDYNDEIRFTPECGGGMPRKVFEDQEKAQAECDARNIKELKSLFASGEIREYCYGFDDLIPYRSKHNEEHRAKLDTVCTKLFGVDWEQLSDITDNYRHYDREDQKLIIKESSTDADWLELLGCINLNFWEVVTVEKG